MSVYKGKWKEHAYECAEIANMFLVICMQLPYKSIAKNNVGYCLLLCFLKFLPRWNSWLWIWCHL